MAVNELNLSGKQTLEVIEWSFCSDPVLEALISPHKGIITCDELKRWPESEYPALLPAWEEYLKAADGEPDLSETIDTD